MQGAINNDVCQDGQETHFFNKKMGKLKNIIHKAPVDSISGSAHGSVWSRDQFISLLVKVINKLPQGT